MSSLINPARISILPGMLVNQIAAGEVIERPASVVKELVENSIDAGATRIDIDIEAGGTRAIIIRDNGSGIHQEDMELAILRHTTSKLKSREDLEGIISLGFRGEALSSIASVSEFSISSRIAGAQYAFKVRVDSAHGKQELTPAAHPPGTTVEVLNLFHNVPARRKFLRSERTEFLHIFDMVKALVLSRLDININLRHNGKPVLTCPAVESDFRARIQAVMGSSFYRDARPIDAQAGHMHLHGWLGGAATARSQSDRQYLYLNQRMIRDRQITHAIRMAFEAVIPASRYPAYILYLQMDPALVDVNVHPTKQEVRFRQPRDVHDFVLAALHDTRAILPQDSQRNEPHYSSGISAYSIGSGTSTGAFSSRNTALYIQDKTQDLDDGTFGEPIAVLEGNYVVTVHAGELRILDFNRLKYHYLYKRLEQDRLQQKIRVRPLLVPLTLAISERDLQKLAPCFELLTELGLQVEMSGPQSLMLRSLPAMLPDLEFRPLLNDLIALADYEQANTAEFAGTLLQLLARHASNTKQKYSVQQVTDELRLMVPSGISASDRNHAGLWRTLSISELQGLLNDKP